MDRSIQYKEGDTEVDNFARESALFLRNMCFKEN